MRDRAIKDEPLCDQLKPFVTRNGWINHPLIIEMTPWSAAQINRRFAKKATRDNLLAESVSADRVMVVGNTGVDALLYVRAKIGAGYEPIDSALAALPSNKKLVLATLHRRENIGEPLREVLSALRELGKDGDKLIVLPVHLNPLVRSQVLEILGDAPNIRLVNPLQYPDFVFLLSKAWVVVTDSGGVQEEAPTFGLPILIARDTTERPEVIEAGFGRLVGSDFAAIVDGVRQFTQAVGPQRLPGENPFGRGDSAIQIAERLAQSDQLPGKAVQWVGGA